MASLGAICDLLTQMGLIGDKKRTEPITPEEVQLLNDLLKEGRMDQLLDIVGEDPPEDPPEDPTNAIALPENQTDPDAPPWD